LYRKVFDNNVFEPVYRSGKWLFGDVCPSCGKALGLKIKSKEEREEQANEV
jgi:hypothetical protein